jgi:hypothetical protein
MARYGKKAPERRACDGRNEEGQVAKRQVRQEGDEPQESDRDRFVGSA